MSQTVSTLSARLARLEEEISLIRKELTELRRQSGAHTTTPASADLWADKAMQQRSMSDLFAALNIQGPSVGVHALQQQMKDAGLDQNEFSTGIIAAREE